MFVDRRLDLLTADILAATDDDILLAVDDEQIAVLVEIAEIARTEIAIVEKGRLRRRLIVPIALEIGDRADAHLTDRKSVVSGKSVYVRVDLGGRRIIKKKTTISRTQR